MNTQSNTVPRAGATEVVAPAHLAAARTFYWSVRRELWDNPWSYLTPFLIAVLALLVFAASMIRLPDPAGVIAALDPTQDGAVDGRPYSVLPMVLIPIMFIVGIVYCLEALRRERRDNSILFWRSLPVSDLTTALSKASIPLFVLPLLTVTIIITTQLAMLLLGSVILVVRGVDVAPLWTQLPLFRMWIVLLYGLPLIALWHAPLYGWALLISAWAPRATLAWAVLPPTMIYVVERIVLDGSYFASLLTYRITGIFAELFAVNAESSGSAAGSVPGGTVEAGYELLLQANPADALRSAGLWAGLVVAAAFVTGAIWLRRHVEPS